MAREGRSALPRCRSPKGGSQKAAHQLYHNLIAYTPFRSSHRRAVAWWSHPPLTTWTMPRLPRFIRENTEQILAEWETFARTLETEVPMDIVALRDHAKEM